MKKLATNSNSHQQPARDTRFVAKPFHIPVRFFDCYKTTKN